MRGRTALDSSPIQRMHAETLIRPGDVPLRTMKKILIQLDTDAQPSVFDRVVAVDADVDQLFSCGSATPETVEPLVHGAIFTRGGKELANTAIFIGGSNVAAGEALLTKVN